VEEEQKAQEPQEQKQEPKQENKEIDIDKLTDAIMTKMGEPSKQESDEDYSEEDEPKASEDESSSERIDWKKRALDAERKIEAVNVGEQVLKDYPHANKNVVEGLVRKGRSKEAIRNAAKISHNEYLRGQKDAGVTRDQVKKEVENELAGIWGQPDSGDLLTGEAVLTAEKVGKMSREELKKAAATMPYKGSTITENVDWK